MSHDAVTTLANQVKREFRRRLVEEQLPRITRCAELLGDERVWQRPCANNNSVANLILHLCGNTTQWIMAQFTEVRDQRQRDAEFATETGLSVAQLSSRLHEVYTTACDTVDTVSTEQLLANRTVQGYAETGLSAILHVLEHTSGHAGQIYAWTKQATGLDLKFYDL
ncbi:MAG: putative damage-inducible protein DinB [Hyphomicrobiaceae bacterium]|jgi:uncharacterized damage-inducible protein DinB